MMGRSDVKGRVERDWSETGGRVEREWTELAKCQSAFEINSVIQAK
jgi:hypothetical protein